MRYIFGPRPDDTGNAALYTAVLDGFFNPDCGSDISV